jgi:FtsH-binding integral membrane protein
MDAFLVICQGIGLASAAGIRPFLPALLAGALAGADSGLDFDGTDFAFLEQAVWLIVMVAALAAVVGLERRRPDAFEAGTLGAMLAGVSIGVGALLFGASMADDGHPAWIGLVGGVACAALANAAARNFFLRVAKRLDAEARGALAIYKDGAALILAGLAILIPPISLLALGALAWLFLQGRRRDDEKYAGLRSLR